MAAGINDGAQGLRERLMLRKAHDAFASSMPMALVAFQASGQDSETWASYPKGGIAPGGPAPQDIDKVPSPFWWWNQWALVPLSRLLGEGGEALMAQSAEARAQKLVDHLEASGASVSMKFLLGGEGEPKMPALLVELPELDGSLGAIRRLRQKVINGPLAPLGPMASLCFGGSDASPTYADIAIFERHDQRCKSPIGSEGDPRWREKLKYWSDSGTPLVGAAMEAGMMEQIQRVWEYEALTQAAPEPGRRPGAPGGRI